MKKHKRVNRVFRLTMHSDRKTKVICTQIQRFLCYAVKAKATQLHNDRGQDKTLPEPAPEKDVPASCRRY